MARTATVTHTKDELGQHIRNYTIAQPGDNARVKANREYLLELLSGSVWNNDVYNEAKAIRESLKPYTPETLRGGVGRQADAYNVELSDQLKADAKVAEFGAYLVSLVKNGKTVTVRFGLRDDGSVYDLIAVGATPTEKTDADKAIAAAKKAQKKLQNEAGEALRVQAAVAAALAAAAKK